MSTRVSGVVERLAKNMLPLANRLALEIFAEDLDPDVEASNKLQSRAYLECGRIAPL